MKVFLGIDPGLSGALAWVGIPDQPNADLILLDATDMPTVSVVSGKSKKQALNLPALADLMQHPAIPTPSGVWIEEVHAMPGQGVTSMFRFGHAAGAAAGVAAGLGLPTHYVRPTVWQRPFGIRGGEKDKSRLIASQLYPGRADLFKRKKDNGRSDAALIATHAARAS